MFGRPPPPRSVRHPAGHLRADMLRLMDEANQAFADFDSFFGMDDAWSALPASPSMNMRELDDAYELSLAMPDADPESIHVRLDGRLLSVSSHQDTRTPNASSSQHFSSRLLLPGPVEPDALLQITNETGRIRIRIPKPEAPPPTATASR
jgi:HSP20 family molecular chaperone IbpA